jgi:hypothetical protein
MNSDDVLQKTPKGVEEMKTRAFGLPQRMRTVLIQIDGKAAVRDLVARLSAYPDLAAILDRLVEGGFVAVPATGNGTAPARAAADPTQGSVAGALSAEEGVRLAIRDLCRYLHDNLGPDADLVTGRIERAVTRDEFAQASRRAIAMLSAGAGQAKAAQFQARAQALLDTYFASR